MTSATTDIDKSNDAYALHCEAVELRNQKKNEEASAKWAECIAFVPDEPTYLREYADCLARLGQYEDDLKFALRACALEPSNPEGWLLAGAAYGNMGQQENAKRCYDRADVLAPHAPAVCFNRSLYNLLHGNYAEGWREYEYRFLQHQRGRSVMPRWNGAPIPGETLFLWAEQGLGDTIQFVRFVKMARERSQAARIVLEVQRELVPLFLELGIADEVYQPSVGYSIPIDGPFRHAGLMSLPYIMGLNDESQFAPAPYISADPPSVRSIIIGNRNVGVCWRGYAGHTDNAKRSIQDQDFYDAIIAPTEGVSFWSINPAVRLPTDPKCENVDLPTFAETAALIASLDLIITVDTSVAHLAGAMGKPVWILIRYATDWRWCLNYPTTSPWYPSARLFRQKSYGEGWGPVLAEVAEALNAGN